MVQIKNVIIGSPAFKQGIQEGDMLAAVNGHAVKDVLDYMYYSADVNITVDVVREGERLSFRVEKDEYDDLGLEFETFLMDDKQRCSNRCVFCFIDQMPPGMRETLYFKDDDARLSFLQGNYVTLTNLTQEDVDRIIAMKLNVNVSVHTTNPELRVKMMRNKYAGEKLRFIKQMTDSGLRLNCQIVCCPGLNDKDELRRTLTDLSALMPNIESVAVVPVGITKFRENLFPLTLFDKAGAAETIDIIGKFQEKLLKEYGRRVVFPSDEFFMTAERPIPEADFYEDYPQYENGVGMLRSLMDEFTNAIEDAEWEGGERKVTIPTGKCGAPVIAALAKMAEEKFPQLTCQVVPIRNDFFGETITVTGLITAQDLIAQLKDLDLGDEVLISSNMLMQTADIFLDDYTLEDVEKALNIGFRKIASDGYELLDGMMGVTY